MLSRAGAGGPELTERTGLPGWELTSLPPTGPCSASDHTLKRTSGCVAVSPIWRAACSASLSSPPVRASRSGVKGGGQPQPPARLPALPPSLRPACPTPAWPWLTPGPEYGCDPHVGLIPLGALSSCPCRAWPGALRRATRHMTERWASSGQGCKALRPVSRVTPFRGRSFSRIRGPASTTIAFVVVVVSGCQDPRASCFLAFLTLTRNSQFGPQFALLVPQMKTLQLKEVCDVPGA